MRTVIWGLLGLCVFAMATLPAAAQSGPDKPKPLSGRVLEANQQQVRLALFVNVSSPDAPGVVPEEFQQKAAMLLAQAKEFDRLNRKNEARRNRLLANRLLQCRQIEQAIKTGDRIPIVSLRKVTADKVKVGDRLRMTVSAEGNLPDGQSPTRVVLVKDAIEVGEGAPLGVRRLPSLDPRASRTHFEVTGEVSTVGPLVVTIADQKIQVEVPPFNGVLQQAPYAPRDMKPGQPVRAWVRMQDELQIDKITRVLVMLDRPESPFDVEEYPDI